MVLPPLFMYSCNQALDHCLSWSLTSNNYPANSPSYLKIIKNQMVYRYIMYVRIRWTNCCFALTMALTDRRFSLFLAVISQIYHRFKHCKHLFPLWVFIFFCICVTISTSNWLANTKRNAQDIWSKVEEWTMRSMMKLKTREDNTC